MAADKDLDGFKVPTKTGEVIPDILLDQDDNNANIGSKGASAPSGGTTTDETGLETVSGYAIYNAKGEPVYADNTTELAKYLNGLGANAIKDLKQQYASSGQYDYPVNGKLGTSDPLISLVAKALNYQQITGTKLPLKDAVSQAISADVATGATGGTSRTSGSLTAKPSATAEIQDTFKTMLGEPAPKGAVDAYYKELNALEMSRVSKAKTIKGVDVTTKGVTEQERIDLLNKYVNQYAKIRITAADAGDPVAQANLGKGQFGIAYTTLKNAYFENGIPISPASFNRQVLESASNTDRLKANMNLINLQAKTIFPALTDKIDAGYTVKQLLSPYLQSRANILEEDADTIDIKELKDVAKDPKGLMNLYDYEVSLRQNPKWRFTKNAQDSMAKVASKLAQTFGFGRIMALTKAQWNSFQAKLPPSDRTPYEEYLQYAGADAATVEETARAVSATSRSTGRTAAVPTSSVPVTPVNRNIPAPVDPNPNRAVLAPNQYPMAEITTYDGTKTKVYTSGPLQGQDVNGQYPIQASGTTAQPVGGDNPDIVNIMSGLGGRTPTIPGGGTDTTVTPSNPLNTSLTAGQVDSVAAIKALLSAYGIGDLGDAVTNAVIKGYSEDTIDLIMQDPNSNDPLAVAFQKRFSANKARAAAGKSVLSPGAYLALERQYTETMRSYGVAGLAKQETLSSFISNDVSPTEVADRVGLAVTRIQNADPDTKKALAQYYPMLSQTDIVTAFLDPKEGLPALQRKVTMAEIGGAALAQGMKVAQTTAADLADYGVTKDEARSGYATVAELTPRAEFLSQISQGPDYGQAEAEAEVFKGTASAKRARQSLTAIEQARFQGSAGTGKGSLGASRQGQF